MPLGALRELTQLSTLRKPVSRQPTPRRWAAVRVRTLRTVGLTLSWEDRLLSRVLGEGVRNEGQDR